MNRVLEMQLKEIEEANERTALLNPKTRDAYLKRKRELEKLEEYGKEYYRKTRLLG